MDAERTHLAIPTDIPHLIVVNVGEAKGVDHGVSRLLCSP